MTLTLHDLRDLAVAWCPIKARWEYLIDVVDYWGPAHELAHAILSRPEERARRSYGLCEAGECRCVGERCHVVELAAHRISYRLLAAAGREDLGADDINATDHYAEVATHVNYRASWRMLREERLWPVPRTRRGLERLLARRLGTPVTTLSYADASKVA